MQPFTFGFWFLGAFLSLTAVVLGRDADPTEDFCALSAHMSGVPCNLPNPFLTLSTHQILNMKDGTLYIAGGWMQYPSGYEDYNGPNTVLRLLDVSKSFRTSEDSVKYIRTEGVPVTIPGVSDAAFFPTESGFDLTFGRWWPYNSTVNEKGDPPIEDKKWQFDIATRKWTHARITLRNWFETNTSKRISSSMTAWIPSLKKGFLFGGNFVSVANETSLWRDLEEHNGLITYDQATNTWTNETTRLGGTSEGALVHITTATDEVLIQFGGRSGISTHLAKFTEINIYSTNRSKWYTQYLPPDAQAPTPRFAFCTALKSASDGSSHQIYIMGGLEASTLVDATGGVTTASIWVLSIPSFEWALLKVSSKTTAADPKSRVSPKCQTIGEHFIFYYGGRNTLNYYSPTQTCDKKGNAAFLFDVDTSTWTDEFTPNEGTYEVPPEIIAHIGGDKSGGSTQKAPKKGWSDPDLETIMTLKTTTTDRNPERGANSDSHLGSSKTEVGAIAGGTVAGVAVALGILGGDSLSAPSEEAIEAFSS